MIAIEITRPIRFFFLRLKIRRRLPAAWNEVPQGRRLFVFRALVRHGEVEALRIALRLRRGTWARIGEADKGAMLAACPWLKAEPSPSLVIGYWSLGWLRPTKYLFPDANFVNGSCMEFALADEYLGEFLEGNEKSLPLLTATLLRERDTDTAAAIKREDLRMSLHGRMEVELRAKRQKRLPQEVHVAALLYFIGVKKLVDRLYGDWLFERKKEKDVKLDGSKIPSTDAVTATGDPLGWWGLMMDVAEGNVQLLDAIQQSNFHNFCTMEVRKRKQNKEAEMRSRMAAPDFGHS